MNENNHFETHFTDKRPVNPKQVKNVAVIVIVVIILIVVTALVSTSFYTVNDMQKAVVTTFGKVTGITESGIHFKIPFGVQSVALVDVNEYKKIEIGYQTLANGTSNTVPNESKMITGDFNIVNVDFFVEYKIADPVKYLFNSESPTQILKNITQSQIRNIISSYKVDDILTTKKEEIQVKIKNLIIAELETYDIGLTLLDIKIQDAEPPTEEVIEAFKSVETAKQDKQTAINDARAYENANLPKAKAQEDQLIKNAEFLKQNRINEAVKQVAMFEAMFSQYKLNPLITKQRMYYEMLEQVLPGVKVFIDTSTGESGVSKLLPLENFSSSSGN